MAETDWTLFNDGLDANTVDRGVTAGITPPGGGGTFTFGFNSLSTAQGAVALYTNQAGFAPTSANKGGSVRGGIQRGVSGGVLDFAAFFIVGAQGPSVNDNAYLLGLMDDDPHHIALRKGSIVGGIPSASPGSSGILRRSTATYLPGDWLHLRVDMIVNINGDVVLKCFSSDSGDVTAPVWDPIPGIENTALVATFGAGIAFVDDALAINSGTQPYTSGRMGFGMFTKNLTRRAFFDQVECFKQS